MDERGGVDMQKVTITMDALEEEIKLCEEVINQWQTKLDALIENDLTSSRRLDVLNLVSNRLPMGMAKDVNQANIDMEGKNRIEILKETSRHKSQIDHYSKILAVLLSIKEENK